MSSKKISELSAKIPVSTDIIPVADPITGVAGKSTISQINLVASGIPAITGSQLYIKTNQNGDQYVLDSLFKLDVINTTDIPVSSTTATVKGATVGRRTFSTQSNGSAWTNLTSLTFSELTILATAGSNGFTIIGFPALQTISAPALYFTNSVHIENNPSLTLINFQILSEVNNFYISGNNNLIIFSWLFLKYCFGNFVVKNCPSLQSIQLPVFGVSGDVDLSGNAIGQLQIDYVLQFLVSYDGTNGKILYGSGRNVNLSGGTNASPSATGIGYKNILVSRGCTVTHN